MSQDHMNPINEALLDKAIEALKSEAITAEGVAGARTRVWERMTMSAAACGEFRPQLQDYLHGKLADSRRLLVEDHLGRCPECRRELAALKGERKVFTMPQRSVTAVWWQRWRAAAVAACLLLGILYLGRHRIDSMLAPGGPRMTVEMASGEVYRLPEGALQQGATLSEGEVVRTAAGGRAVLRLADGSAVEMNERSELFVKRAWSGYTVNLRRGDVIVQAAAQRRGSLQVETRDSVASVKGTIFAVSAGFTGSLVSVVEGQVAVRNPGGERMLARGQQAASNPALETVPVGRAISWSRDRERYIALLGEFARLEQQIAQMPKPALRTEARLVRYLPANTVIFAAAPNMSGTLRQAINLADQRAAESPVFREWWESESGREFREVLDRIQTVAPLLGEEIAFVVALNPAVDRMKAWMPAVLAEVQPGRAEALRAALETLRSSEARGLAYHLTDQLVVISESERLPVLLSTLGQGASSPFGIDIAGKYSRGVGWLLGINASFVREMTMIGPRDAQAAVEASGAGRVKYLFIESRATPGGEEENQATVTFDGARTGMASWLATSGSTGAAEYISSDAVAVFAASTREPRQVYDELIAQLSRIRPEFQQHLQEQQAKLGIDLGNDIAAAIGTDFAFAIERVSVPVPGWVGAVAVHSPSALDATVQKLVQTYNSSLPPERQNQSLVLEQETVNGRVWNTLRPAASPLLPIAVTWTYDRGYLVAAADRALGTRAIATRDGGFPLVFSAAFRMLLPAGAGLHPSGFVWLNTHNALEGIANFLPPGSIKSLVENRQPFLAVVNGETEQIRASSRTRLTSLILDVMMTNALTGGVPRSATAGVAANRENRELPRRPKRLYERTRN